METDMLTRFDAFEVNTQKFVVVFAKQDGTIREIEGYLFDQSKLGGMSDIDVTTALVDIQESHMVRVYTDKGIKSFIKSNLIKWEIVK
jgi:methenyltetrahydromethanopterin cyclohydrolase